ncbi:MAG: hypothetical protein IPM29_27325 [Planctomycetes bacterium]|nr:hypothetical protein [Planctomycetota bacterium]
MIRRLNYTGRKRIPTHAVQLRVHETSPPTFEIRLDAAGLGFPASAEVFVDVFRPRSTTTERHLLGSVGDPAPVVPRELEDGLDDGVEFEVKVIDTTESIGRLLGVTSRMRPSLAGDAHKRATTRSLLPVNACELGDDVWRLDFSSDRPRLDVNARIPGIKELARSDRTFFALVYPAVLRRILTHILLVEEMREFDAGDDSWQAQWLKWAMHWHPDRAAPPPEAEDIEVSLQWIEEVASGFCTQRQVATQYEWALGHQEED